MIQHCNSRYMLITYDDFEAMKQKVDPRKVYGPYEAPPELVALIVPELDRLIEEEKQTKRNSRTD